MSVGEFLARRLFAASLSSHCRSATSFSARVDDPDTADPAVRFRKALFEVSCYGDLFRCFPAWDVPGRLAGQTVLDFGCGYGGKTVEYATRCGAARVCGVEPFADVVESAAAFARHRGVENVDFRVCGHLDIPYEDATFDSVLTMDVMEHVENPSASLKEIQRVLKPGGRAFIAFPPYSGMMSHHLDYICNVPGVHWFFSPQTLVHAVNATLQRDAAARAHAKPQPEPKLSWDGDRYVLPNLNGLTGTKFQRLATELFEVESLEWAVVGRNHTHGWKRWVHTALKPITFFGGRPRDAVTASIAGVLRKRA